jgi:hypothetical protein
MRARSGRTRPRSVRRPPQPAPPGEPDDVDDPEGLHQTRDCFGQRSKGEDPHREEESHHRRQKAAHVCAVSEHLQPVV